jgi:glycosyltransferase involved in cell wall biosynthesis
LPVSSSEAELFMVATRLRAGTPLRSRVAEEAPVRVLYSFPHKIGAARICTTAWYQVNGLTNAGARPTVFAGAVHRPLPSGVEVRPTLARGKVRLPYRVLRRKAFALHDAIVARRLQQIGDAVDVVHTWPLGALRTLRVARALGIPTVLERPNAHTRFAYEVVRAECLRLGVELPSDHEHAYNADVLAREEAEYALADHLLCPSDFVAQTFVDQGFPTEKLARHRYGFDRKRFYPGPVGRPQAKGLTMLFVGVAAVRKGVHFALEAWLASPASQDGTFLIAGEFLSDYEKKLRPMLEHHSVRVLGHRDDVDELMRESDVFVLPSIEEGFPLATVEARASGCVPLVSEACSAPCTHMVNGLVHRIGDVKALSEHIAALHRDGELVRRLREASLSSIDEFSWDAAGVALLEVYRGVIAERRVMSDRL